MRLPKSSGQASVGIPGSRGAVFVLALLVLLLNQTMALHAQSNIPRAGHDFSFGIIEGPDRLGVTDTTLQPSHITVTVTSPFDGCGVYVSPYGEAGQFSFTANKATIFDLPYNLIHLTDLGKTKKGITIHTNEPVNIVLQDSMPEAGEATQIFPDEALDTNYVIGAWGLYNDPTEDNHVEFLVTASQDNTQVTITPAVRTLAGDPAGVPIKVTLMKGECYMVKADSGSQPTSTSLSGSTVKSNKPVSVIMGITCAYVPLGQESCNEIMDEILGKKWWGEHYFVQPLGNLDPRIELLITSDTNFFVTVNGSPSASTNNRIYLEVQGAAEIETLQPTQMEQLTRGSTFSSLGQSDPSAVTIFDTSHYADTMIWNAPHIVESDFTSFANWAPIIYPTADSDKILLDGIALNAIPVSKLYAPVTVINGTRWSAINPMVDEGVHTLVSKVPIFSLATGFQQADAYSFIPGTIGPAVPHDTAHHTVVLKAEPANACENFGVTATLDIPLTPQEFATSFQVVLHYDATTLYLVGIEPHAVLTSATYTVDSSTPGTLVVSVFGIPLGGSDLFRMIFGGSHSAVSTYIGKNSATDACADAIESIPVNAVTFAVEPSTDSLHRTLSLHSSPAKSCTPHTLVLLTDSIISPKDKFIPVRIEAQFDTSLEYLRSATPGPPFTNVLFTHTGDSTGDYKLKVNTPIVVSGSDTVIVFNLLPHAASDSATIKVRVTYLLCGDTVVKTITLTDAIAANIDSAKTTLSLAVSSVTFGNPASADVTLSGLPNSAAVTKFDLIVNYDGNVLKALTPDMSGTLTSGWTASVQPITATSARITFTSSGGPLGTAGVLTHLSFQTFISDSSSSPITVTSSLPGVNKGCAVTYISAPTTTLFLGKNLCGDSTLRAFLMTNSIQIESAGQSDGGGIVVNVMTGSTPTVNLSVSNMMGESVWSSSVAVTPGLQTIRIPGGSNLPSGAYIVRAEANRMVSSRKVILTK